MPCDKVKISPGSKVHTTATNSVASSVARPYFQQKTSQLIQPKNYRCLMITLRICDVISTWYTSKTGWSQTILLTHIQIIRVQLPSTVTGRCAKRRLDSTPQQVHSASVDSWSLLAVSSSRRMWRLSILTRQSTTALASKTFCKPHTKLRSRSNALCTMQDHGRIYNHKRHQMRFHPTVHIKTYYSRTQQVSTSPICNINKRTQPIFTDYLPICRTLSLRTT